MKLLIAGLLVSICAPLSAGDGASVPAITEHGTHVHGDSMPLGKPLPVGTALSSPAWNGKRGKFEGRVTQVCQKEGCWMILAEGDRYARVFTGHAFELPKDASGRAIVYGKLGQRTIDEAFAKHMAEDAGRNPDTVVGDQIEFRIDAVSVELIPAPQARRP